MKTFLMLLISFCVFSSGSNAIFTEDLFVKDIAGKEVNLKNIKITKDTVMVFAWAKWCGSCKRNLDYYKAKKRYRNYQILAIAITQGDSTGKEKAIVNEHQWPFQVYFDGKQNLAKYFYKKGYYKQSKNEKEVRFTGYPGIYMFVKSKYLCNSCDKYANPSSQK